MQKIRRREYLSILNLLSLNWFYQFCRLKKMILNKKIQKIPFKSYKKMSSIKRTNKQKICMKLNKIKKEKSGDGKTKTFITSNMSVTCVQTQNAQATINHSRKCLQKGPSATDFIVISQ